MKKFTYNGQQYEVQEKEYKYHGYYFNCLYIKSDNFECVVDGMNLDAITDDVDFAIVMENEYLIKGNDCLKLVKSFK